MKNGKAKAVRFSTLEAICKALDCQPGDILEYKSEYFLTSKCRGRASDAMLNHWSNFILLRPPNGLSYPAEAGEWTRRRHGKNP